MPARKNAGFCCRRGRSNSDAKYQNKTEYLLGSCERLARHLYSLPNSIIGQLVILLSRLNVHLLLCQDIIYDVAVDIRQATLKTIVVIGKPLMIEAHQVQHCRVQII